MNTNTEKAKSIQLLILDIDGILTDGTIYYGNAGIELKAFHVSDCTVIQAQFIFKLYISWKFVIVA